ncbi:hypothetical protein EK21DRAFT_117376 [Setomelanomma holmii]|uniref:Uncharacterized protein n=1 Tax=Setomelanomma holmii TaxID=210430 RepID=A0A9P4H195_9PLEO|nr:hypothetical protein EK21DRAFT_117376 [Setomelanomma holmii]
MDNADLLKALDSLSPSRVVDDYALRTGFREFFRRGTRLECRELLPDGVWDQDAQTTLHATHVTVREPHQPQDLTPQNCMPGVMADVPPDVPPDDMLQDVPRPVSTQHQDVMPLEVVCPVKEWFQVHYGSQSVDLSTNKQEVLVKVATRLAKSQGQEIPGWSNVPKHLASEDPTTLAKELYHILQDSSSRHKERLYFTTAVATMTPTTNSRGERTITAALNQLSEELKVERSILAKLYTAGQKDLTLMEFAGPAALYYMHIGKSEMEKLNKWDLEALCMFRETKLPDSTKVSRNQDKDVAYILLRDFLALGYTYNTTDSTRLMKLIKKSLGETFLREHFKHNSRVSEASQSPTLYKQVVENQREDALFESATMPTSVGSALTLTTTTTNIMTTGPESGLEDDVLCDIQAMIVLPTIQQDSLRQSSAPEPRYCGEIQAQVPYDSAQQSGITPCSGEANSTRSLLCLDETISVQHRNTRRLNGYSTCEVETHMETGRSEAEAVVLGTSASPFRTRTDPAKRQRTARQQEDQYDGSEPKKALDEMPDAMTVLPTTQDTPDSSRLPAISARKRHHSNTDPDGSIVQIESPQLSSSMVLEHVASNLQECIPPTTISSPDRHNSSSPWRFLSLSHSSPSSSHLRRVHSETGGCDLNMDDGFEAEFLRRSDPQLLRPRSPSPPSAVVNWPTESYGDWSLFQ